MSQTIESTTDESVSEETVLEMRNVEVTFEMSRGRARVLDDINLEIQRGESIGIAGESGCGKSMFGSTLLNAVSDPGKLSGEIIYYPEEGDPIDIADLGYSDLRKVRWDRISMVFQGAMNAFNPALNLRTHFKETLEAHNENVDEGMDRAAELLETLDLSPERIFDAYQNELSGGERQRVLLALSLLLEPDVLVMDEPTAALDLVMQRKILQLLYEIKEEQDITLVFISHDFPVLAGFVDRLAIMYAFEIIELGDAREVLLNPEHPYTRSMLEASIGLSTPIEDVMPIKGQTPDPINVPTGCSFHPRCPISDDRCEVEDPELRAEADSSHGVACFYPDRAVDQIPVDLEDDPDHGGAFE